MRVQQAALCLTSSSQSLRFACAFSCSRRDHFAPKMSRTSRNLPAGHGYKDRVSTKRLEASPRPPAHSTCLVLLGMNEHSPSATRRCLGSMLKGNLTGHTCSLGLVLFDDPTAWHERCRLFCEGASPQARWSSLLLRPHTPVCARSWRRWQHFNQRDDVGATHCGESASFSAVFPAWV